LDLAKQEALLVVAMEQDSVQLPSKRFDRAVDGPHPTTDVIDRAKNWD